MDSDARTIAEQDGISCLPNHVMQLVELLLGCGVALERSAKILRSPE
jgi:hypothetical protein